MATGHVGADKAPIGYKIQKGDWIILKVRNAREKAFQVTDVTSRQAIVKWPKVARGKRTIRNAMRFPRYYSIPFYPLEKKTKPNYFSHNTWYVKINDKNFKKVRLSHDKALRQ